MDLGSGFFAALDLLPEPILLVGPDRAILAANAALRRLLRLPGVAAGGRKLSEIAADTPEQLQEYLGRCARSGQFLVGTIHLRRPDGAPVRYRAEGAAFRIQDTAQAAAVLLRLRPAVESGAAFLALNEKIRQLNAEIAGRKLIEADLHRERETLEVTLASIGDAVAVTDGNGCVTFLNSIAEKLMACRLDDARGRPLAEVFHIINETTRRTVENPIRQVFETGFVVGLANHTVLIRPDGTAVPIDDSAAPIRLGNDIIGAVLIFRDITSRRRAEAALRDADRRKDEFLATLAHELRNPLAPIRNALQVMAAGQQDPERIASLKAIIDRQVKHMARLIDDLMDISRITQGRIDMRRERIALDVVLQLAIETSRPFLEAKRQRLTVKHAPERVFINADVIRMAQVLSNLISNSAKYSPAGTEIVIGTEREPDHVIVTVTDQGVGIPADMLDQVFEMFIQVDRPGMREGLGIGLTLVKRIVELHGGTVEAHSMGEGAGSQFRVRLETVEPSDAASESAKPVIARKAGTAGRILVADDNRDAAHTLAMMLELDGHAARVAYDGRQALEIAEEFRPHVALLDIGMPNMDGYQTARQIRERQWGRSVMLIALTGWGQAKDRERATSAGFDRHFVKPFDAETLRAVIDEAVRCHAASGTSPG